MMTISDNNSEVSNENLSGQRLKECRKEKRMTLSELAEKAGKLQQSTDRKCSPNNISAIESGRRKLSLNYATIFGQILGVRTDYLLGDSPYKTDADLHYATEMRKLKKDREFHFTSGPLAALQLYLDFIGIEWEYENVNTNEFRYQFHMWGYDTHMQEFDCRLDSEETEVLGDYIFQFALNVIEQTVRSDSNGES